MESWWFSLLLLSCITYHLLLLVLPVIRCYHPVPQKVSVIIYKLHWKAGSVCTSRKWETSLTSKSESLHSYFLISGVSYTYKAQEKIKKYLSKLKIIKITLETSYPCKQQLCSSSYYQSYAKHILPRGYFAFKWKLEGYFIANHFLKFLAS